VKTKTLVFDANSWISNQVQGNFLIAFGEKAGQFFSNEPAPVDGLREIIFGATNQEDEEIPVIVSYGISDLLKNPTLKKNLWNDLLFARSVYLETYM
jgi:uracil-DNA glycosylase